jgi:predicted NAD/FAD-binding protein
MLSLRNRPRWRIIRGGSREYVKKLVRPFEDRIRLSTPVEQVRRTGGGVELGLAGGDMLRFDAVVLACHSDQALRMLADPSEQEQSVLGAIRYQENEVVLHTDTSLLPRRKLAWSSWNYHLGDASGRVAVTYYMNRLQNLNCAQHYCVTLNRSHAIDPERVVQRFNYTHPIFDRAAIEAQRQHAALNDSRTTVYCGAYWGHGFHEDGVQSALRACAALRGVPT